MSGFFAALVAFPTVLFSVLLAVVLVYWVFVIVGALDIDLFSSGEGVADGLGAGVKGAAEGIGAGLKGAADALGAGLKAGGEAVDAAGAGLKAAGEAVDAAGAGLKAGGEAVDALTAGKAGLEAHAPTAHEVAGLFGALGFRKVPVTVAGSLLVWAAWLLSLLGRPFAHSLVPAGTPELLVGLGVLVLSSLGAFPLASIFVRPLGPLFAVKEADRRAHLAGRLCTIDTTRVDARFGQALVDESGAGALIQVRCERDNQLRRGDRALIVSYEPDGEFFRIEPLTPDDAAALGAERDGRRRRASDTLKQSGGGG